jgi:hypothetical protein
MDKALNYRFPTINFLLLLKKFWYVFLCGLALSFFGYFGYAKFVDKPFYSATGALCNSEAIGYYDDYNDIVSVIKSDVFLDNVSKTLKNDGHTHATGDAISGSELKQYITVEDFTARTVSAYLHITFTWKENLDTVEIFNEYLKLSSAEVNAKLQAAKSSGRIDIDETKNIYATQINVSSSSSFKNIFMFAGFGLVVSFSLAIGMYLKKYDSLRLLNSVGAPSDLISFSLR